MSAMRAAARIAVVDLETTGLDPAEDAVIELARCDLLAPADLLGAPDWGNAVVAAPMARLFEAGRAIPPESSAVHHLLPEDLAGRPRFASASAWVWLFSPEGEPCAWAAHNAKFEIGWLAGGTGEVPWLCTWKCACRAWPEAPGHGNQVLRYWKKPAGLDRELAQPAHRAGPDAYVTAHLLRELLREHDLATLLQWSREPTLLPRVPFGRRPEEGGARGLPWDRVETSLLHWVLERDFDENVIFTARHELERRRGGRAGRGR